MNFTMPEAGRAAIASAIRARTIMLAVGRGDGAWDGSSGAPIPDITGSETSLLDPIAMVRPNQNAFVAQDGAGTIEMPDGTRWAQVAGPTPHVHLSYTLGFGDDPGEVLREMALYLDPELSADAQSGQTYIPWAAVTRPGAFLAIKRVLPIERLGVRQTFDEILTF